MIKQIPHTRNPKLKHYTDYFYSRDNSYKIDLNGFTYDLIDTSNYREGVSEKLIVEIVHVKTVNKDTFISNIIKNEKIIIDNVLGLQGENRYDLILNPRQTIRLEKHINNTTEYKNVLVERCTCAFLKDEKPELSLAECEKRNSNQKIYLEEKKKIAINLIKQLKENDIDIDIKPYYVNDMVQVIDSHDNVRLLNTTINFVKGRIGKILDVDEKCVVITWGSNSSGSFKMTQKDFFTYFDIEIDYNRLISTLEDRISTIELRNEYVNSIEEIMTDILKYDNYIFNRINNIKKMTLSSLEDEVSRLRNILYISVNKNKQEKYYFELVDKINKIDEKYSTENKIKEFKNLTLNETNEYITYLETLIDDYVSSINIENDIYELEDHMSTLKHTFKTRKYNYLSFSFLENSEYKKELEEKINTILENIELHDSVEKLEKELGPIEYDIKSTQIHDKIVVNCDCEIDRMKFKKNDKGTIITISNDKYGILFDNYLENQYVKGHDCKSPLGIPGRGWFLPKDKITVLYDLKSKNDYLLAIKEERLEENLLISQINEIRRTLGEIKYKSVMLSFNGKIEIGSKVEMKEDCVVDNAKFEKSMSGKVVEIRNSTYGIEWDFSLSDIGVSGNTCNRKSRIGYGWYVPTSSVSAKITLKDKLNFLLNYIN